MRPQTPLFCLIAAAFLGCAASPPPPERVVEIPRAASPASPPPIASIAPAAPRPPPPEASEPDCSDTAFAARLADVKAAEASGDRDRLREAIKKALSLRAKDAALHTKLARMLHAEGDIPSAGAEGQVIVEVTEGKDAFGWLLVGLAAKASGKAEDARAAFARSAVIEPNGEAARELGAASRCTAAASTPTDDDKLTIVTGWRGVFDKIEPSRMVHEEKPDPTTEREAMARVCINNDLSEITERDVCHGPGPWEVQTGHLHFHDHRAIILPLPGKRFAVIPYFTGDGCRGGLSVSARLTGGIVEISLDESGVLKADAGVCDDGMHDGMTGPCITSASHTESFYDAATGKALLQLEDHDATEKYELTGAKLRRTGPAGCDETVDLRKLPAYIQPK